MIDLRLKLLRLVALLALMLGVGHCAYAATTIYGIRGTATAGANDIIRLDPTTGAFTVVYNNYPGGNAATIAQCPSGLIYYAINTGVNQLYVFNPQTPTVAPATLGTGLPDGGLKMACSPGGVLYYLTEAATNNLHIISTTTGTYTGAAVTVTGEGAGGDMAFDSGGTLYGFNNTGNLFTIPLAGGAVTSVGTGAVTGLNGSGIGLAFDASNGIRVLTNGTPSFYSVNTGTNPPSATSLSTPPGGAATGDLASINVPDPDLSISKSANISSVAYGLATPVVYTIVVTNNSAYRVSGTVTDTFPAAVSGETWTCSASAGSTCVAAGAGNINTIATLAAGGTATYTVNATVNAVAPVVNTANVALPFTFLTDATPANNSASNTILIRPSVSKAFGAASFVPGGNTSLTITIGNANGAPITTSAVFTDTLPTSPGAMTVNTAGSTGTCPNVTAAAGSGSISMASGTVIPDGGCTIIVSITASAVGTYTNTIAAGALVTTVGSNPAAASANVNVYAPPTVTKAFGAASFAPGGNTSVTITIGNTNGVAITTSAVFTDTLPAAPGPMTVNTAGSTGTCANVTATLGSGSITMASGTSIPAGGCTIIVSVTAAVPGTYNNTIAAGALVTNAGSNAAASASVDVVARPTVTKSFGAASFGSGGNTSLTITIGNTNPVAITTSAIFTDTLPVAPGAMTVNTTGSTGTCANVTATAGSGSISMASGTSIPAGGCTIIVSITAMTVGAYTNTIAAGDLVTSAGTNLNPASANVTVTAVPVITKTFSPVSIASGGTSTLIITLTNPTGVAMTNATFDDYFPTSPGQMVVANPTGLINNCGGTIRRAGGGGGTLDPGDLGIRLSGGTIPANGSCTVIVNVTATVAGIYSNTIPVGELTVNGGRSNTVAANATLTVGLPSFTVAKSVLTYSDPLNGTTLPKAIPGAVVTYSIQVTNTGLGTADNNTTLIVDPIPANTRLFVGDLGGAGSGPIAFVNGTPSSGLTYTFTSLASGADDVAFSNTGCSPFTNYTPVPDVDGFDAAVTCIRVNPKGIFAAASGGNNPSFQARFRVRVN
jgi:uncharacterized repeat protein (TIGR01451 family)